MNTLLQPRHQPAQVRHVESEGILRILLLAAALAMPLASVIFLKVQGTRLSYQMNAVKEQIRTAEETQRKLLLERSRFQRDEEIQAYAARTGLLPRKQGHLIPRSFTSEDQKLAKLGPVPSARF